MGYKWVALMSMVGRSVNGRGLVSVGVALCKLWGLGALCSLELRAPVFPGFGLPSWRLGPGLPTWGLGPGPRPSAPAQALAFGISAFQA